MYPEGTAVGLAIVMLIFAAIDDVRRRRVDNRWWIPFLGAAVVLDVMLLARDGITSASAIYVGVGLFACGLFYLMWRFRLFGGADAKGLMVLALLVPVPPVQPATIFALDTLSNGLLVAMVLPLLFAIWNLAHGHAAFPAMFLGFRMHLRNARDRLVWPMQQVGEHGVQWVYRRAAVLGDDPWESLEEHGVERPWVTPMVPFMVPLAAGAIAAAIWGNLLVKAMLLATGP